MSTATAASAPESMESFAALFEESLEHQEMRQGEVITAEIVGIDHNFVTVNAGLKSESLICFRRWLAPTPTTRLRACIK
jgi:small subunit ribosomal protein S1